MTEQNEANAMNSESGISALVRPDLLGFSFHLAWLCLFMYNVVPGFAGQPNHNIEFGAFDPVYFYSMVSLVIVLGCGIARTKNFMHLVRSRAGVIAAPVACSLGTLIYAFSASGLTPAGLDTALLVIGGILSGAGSAFLAAHWASAFGRAKARTFIVNLPLIFAAVLITCLAITYLFAAIALVFATLLPLASGACLIYADRYAASLSGQVHSEANRSKSKPARSRHIYLILIAAVCLIGLTTGSLNQIELINASYHFAFSCITSVLILLITGWLIVQDNPKAFLPLFVAPLVVFLIFALPLIRFTPNDAPGIVYAVGSVTFALMLMFEAVLFALLFDLSCAKTFMIGRVVMALSDLCGALCTAAIMEHLGNQAGAQFAGGALLVGSEVVIAGLLMMYLLLRRKSLSRPELNTRAAGVDMPTQEVAVRPEEAADISQATESTLSQSEIAADLTAERFGLSPREADVLRLLVAGESTAQIQDTLCIAPGTFNYHMRNIYSKLGVHSRQELLVFIYNQQEQQKQ